MSKQSPKPTVFISSSLETLSFALKIAEELSPFANHVISSNTAFVASSPITSQLRTVLSSSDFALFLFDEYSRGKETRRRSLRKQVNAIFELGFVAGAIGIDRLLIVTMSSASDPVRMPSDILGMTHIALRSGAIRRTPNLYAQKVAREVRNALRRVEPRPEQLASSFSCFISYAHEDRLFATRLHEDLTEIGVRCWLDAQELRIGDSLIDSIESGLRVSDRMVAVVSSHALGSDWLATELKLALELEKHRSSKVILPVRLDDAIFQAQNPVWTSVRSRYMADFTGWTDPPQYKRAFASLARELTLSVAAQESAP